jgi:hypothetical protein
MEQNEGKICRANGQTITQKVGLVEKLGKTLLNYKLEKVMDSWFTMPATLTTLAGVMPVTGMVK